MRFSTRIVYMLVTGYILTYYSEWMFWSGRPPSENFVLEAIPSWIAYSFITFLFLMAVTYFRARTVWAIFLAGALYGWLLEGGLVQTMYDAFPIQISFTGLSWHALISVVFGWYWLPRQMRQSRAVLPYLLFGLCLGLWSIGWWLEPDVAVAPIEAVFLYNFAFGLPLIPAYVLRDRFNLGDFRPTRLEIIGALILSIVYFGLVTIQQQPLALVVLPLLLVVVVGTLWKNRLREADIPAVEGGMTVRQALPLVLIPLTASVVYATALSIGVTFPSLQVVYAISMPAGFILLGVSVYQIVRRA